MESQNQSQFEAGDENPVLNIDSSPDSSPDNRELGFKPYSGYPVPGLNRNDLSPPAANDAIQQQRSLSPESPYLSGDSLGTDSELENFTPAPYPGWQKHYCGWNRRFSEIHACDKCDGRYKCLDELARHKLRHHSINCQKCGSVFPTVPELVRHQLNCQRRLGVNKRQRFKRAIPLKKPK